MKKKFFLYGGIAIILSVVIILQFNNKQIEFMNEDSLELDFTYSDANSQLKENLEKSNISMSSPILLRDHNSIEIYCIFFDDIDKQKFVEYCTSTELLDSRGNFLGNIHMVGSKQMPKLVIALVQADPFMHEIDEIKSIFTIMIESLVCKCWKEIKPSDLNSIEEWIDRHQEFHTSDTKPHSKSSVIINEKKLQIELTTNNKGYLWKLLIGK